MKLRPVPVQMPHERAISEAVSSTVSGASRSDKTIRFTERVVAQLPPPPHGSRSACSEYSDLHTPGLKTQVTKKSVRTYYHRFTYRGVKCSIRIGVVGQISLEEARETVRLQRAELDRGNDPRAKRAELEAIPLFRDFTSPDGSPYMSWATEFKRSYDDDASKIRLYLIPEFGSYYLNHITTQMVHLYIGKLRKTLSTSTCNRHLSLLSRIFRLAMQWNIVDKNPCQGIAKFKESLTTTDAPTPDEVGRIFDAAALEPSRSAALAIQFLCCTGLRYGEVVKLRKDVVSFESRTIFLAVTKSGRSRNVVLNDTAVEVLRAAFELGESEWVFPGRDPSKPICNLRKPLRRILKAAGLKVCRVHSLRHGFAGALVSHGVSLFQVQKLLGHASPQTSQRYSHLADHTLREAAQVFTREVRGQQ